MKAAHGSVFKYGDNVDTDVIIPARYLNSSDPKELATHCMEDIDKDFVKNVHVGDIIVANKTLDVVLPVSMHRFPSRHPVSAVSLLRHLPESFTGMPSISVCRSLSAHRPQRKYRQGMRWK